MSAGEPPALTPAAGFASDSWLRLRQPAFSLRVLEEQRLLDRPHFCRPDAGRAWVAGHKGGYFDGANTPIELSWRNEVIWIAPESRYRRFLSHSWVKYDESKHKGAFIRAFTIDGIMKGLKKVLGGTKWIDACVKCEDEGKEW